ncbi:adenosylcobinamide-GDP ribazoletransferase [Bradyrhizobium sp.]|uniref:adenosylcobinamide-GDP ribazoletransferase n=1 Tax=Bradyrhizobium sp. TaxID=376 RepID=UPI002D5A654A|nr:adenosylcobinamide-GDP ribazoletransferase [Bradyrhizobium sp.]HZR71732.1 adenosylcobinamide-GDP ribazoletransferase [Bradyrhizobium sp.]
MRYAELLERIVIDIRIAMSLATILPVGPAKPLDNGAIARTSWALPVAGLVVGLVGAIIYAIAHMVHLPPDPAAVLALVATILVTGAIHEDGLADAADGFGGGKSRDEKLEIMRDSRIGTYGACALVVSILVRWSALATIAEPASVASALLVAHAAARAQLPVFMWLIPSARSDGLSAGAGQVSPETAMVAAGLGFLCLAFGLGFGKAILGLILLSLVGWMWAWLATKQIGGQTGDVIGALEQFGEIAILLLAGAMV